MNTTFTNKRVSIDKIFDNPYRNYDLYPIQKDSVASICTSMKASGDFGVIPVRSMGDGTYQQAAGHHRIAALKKLKVDMVDVKVADLDDDEMIRIMTNENTTQQGNNAPAAMDSILAMTEQLAYYLLISDTAEQFAGLLNVTGSGATGKIRGTNFAAWRNAVLAGKPMGPELLNLYAGDGVTIPSGWSIKTINKSLLDSGWIGRTYAAVTARVDEETAAAEEEERKAEEARKRAEAKAKREAEAAKKAAEQARKQAEKAKAAQKKAAEAKAKEAERLAKKRAELRAAEQRRVAEERAEAEERRAKQRAQAEAAKAAQRAAEQAAKGLHPDVLSLLKMTRHQEMFRKVVLSEKAKKVFPMAKHVQTATKMIEWHEDNRVEMSSDTIRDYLNNILINHDAELRRWKEMREREAEKESIIRKVDNRIRDYKRHVSGTNTALVKLAEVLDDDKTGQYAFYEIATDPQLARSLVLLEDMVTRVRSSLTLWETRTRQRADKGTVVSSQ